MLTDFSDDESERGADIPDPHERPLTVYLEVFEMLERLIPQLFAHIHEGPTDEWQHWYDFYRHSSLALGR